MDKIWQEILCGYEYEDIGCGDNCSKCKVIWHGHRDPQFNYRRRQINSLTDIYVPPEAMEELLNWNVE